MFRALLELPEVTEVCELRGTFGLMAFHGGNLERTTDVIAREVAERTGASFYAVIQEAPLRQHVPSTAVDPAHSEPLADFLAHVDTVIAVHGYGREERFWDLLLGGRNRSLAGHLASHLRDHLPDDFGVIDDVDEIPTGLRGQHGSNPVNRPANAGVQLELPPTARWNRDEKNWSDHEGTGRAPQVDLVIDALTIGISSWNGS
jgi:phage replication-related protein YjqB (UPF0714/DUF867 family)